METLEALIERVVRLSKRRGFENVGDFMLSVGLSRRYLDNFKGPKGKNGPTLDSLRRIRDGLDVSWDMLLDGKPGTARSTEAVDLSDLQPPDAIEALASEIAVLEQTITARKAVLKTLVDVFRPSHKR